MVQSLALLPTSTQSQVLKSHFTNSSWTELLLIDLMHVHELFGLFTDAVRVECQVGAWVQTSILVL